jgi:hypothetical protein
VPRDKGFAVPVVGDEVRWLDSKYLLNDTLADRPPLLFDLIKDPNCNVDLWRHRRETGEFLRTKLRAYISLSQTLLRQNRVYP